MIDTELFTKIMMMTTSDHDGECLTAIRKANLMLCSLGINWEQFIDGVRPEAPRQTWTQPDPEILEQKDSNIREAFRIMKDRPMTAGFRQFLDSLYDYWSRNGSLSPKQMTALFNAVNRRST